MEIRVPRKALGITGDTFTLDFKWADNSDLKGNAINWLDKREAAPNARFA
ncbi:hypothetical protein [Daejeonella sp.]